MSRGAWLREQFREFEIIESSLNFKPNDILFSDPARKAAPGPRPGSANKRYDPAAVYGAPLNSARRYSLSSDQNFFFLCLFLLISCFCEKCWEHKGISFWSMLYVHSKFFFFINQKIKTDVWWLSIFICEEIEIWNVMFWSSNFFSHKTIPQWSRQSLRIQWDTCYQCQALIQKHWSTVVLPVNIESTDASGNIDIIISSDA